MKNPTHSAFALAHRALCDEISDQQFNVKALRHACSVYWECSNPQDPTSHTFFDYLNKTRNHLRIAEDRLHRLQEAAKILKEFKTDVNHWALSE